MKDFGLKKLYYSISEVSKLTDLEQYILRYWETEFDQLKPQKNRAGNRIYTNKDIKLILKIKNLLREEKYTIEGAKKIISDPSLENLEQKDMQENKNDKSDDLFIENNGKDNNNGSESNKINIKNDLEQIREFLVNLRSKL